jgi:ATP-binding protein involved in chromosome partitioning
MPSDDGQILELLSTIDDPELGGDIVSLGLVGPIERSMFKTKVTLYYVGGALKIQDELRARANAALSSLGQVDLKLEPLSPEGQAELKRKLVSPEVEEARSDRKPVFSLPSSNTRIIGVSSGKGGVGKSSVTANLAIGLAQLGKKVAILDADVYGFSIPKMLGLTEQPRVVDDIIVPPVAYGVKVMSLGFFVEDDTPVVWRGPMLHSTIAQFLVDVYWGDLDFLVVDMPPGTGDVTLSLQEYLPKSEVYVVTTPQPAATRVAQRSAIAARKLKLPVRGIIENMAGFIADDGKRYEIFGTGGGDQLSALLEVPVLARVPLTMALRTGGDEGRPVIAEAPTDPAAIAIRELAEKVISLGPTRRYRADLKVQAR